MYAYIDRPVAELDLFEAGILHATRKWVHAVTLSPMSQSTALDLADPFDLAMQVLHQESIGSLVVNRPCHTLIGEFEAVLLALWMLVRNGLLTQARATAALVITPASVEALIQAMQRIS